MIRLVLHTVPGAAWLLGALVAVVCGCHASEAGRHIAVSPPEEQDSAVPLADADAADAAAADAANDRGSAPVWPEAEQELAVPYRGGPVRAELTLAATPQKLDLHFNVDSTASFSEEIAALQRELSRTVIPRIVSRVADTHIGVSRFADFPFVPFGRPPNSAGDGDVAFELLCPVTSSLARVNNALALLAKSLGDGADIPEAGAESLYQIATGVGFSLEGVGQLIKPYKPEKGAADGGSAGGVGFRAGALRVVLHITDAPTHAPADYAAAGLEATHGWVEAGLALRSIGAFAIGINSATENDRLQQLVREELSELALVTGAYGQPVGGRCATGIRGSLVKSYRDVCPWVFDVGSDGSGLTTGIVDAVVGLLDSVQYDEVHAEPGDDPLGFIERIELHSVDQAAGVAAPATADLRPANARDGVADSYVAVGSRQRLGFTVVLANKRIAPSDAPQRFRVSVRLFGDGVLLEERLIALRVDAVDSAPQLGPDDVDAGP